MLLQDYRIQLVGGLGVVVMEVTQAKVDDMAKKNDEVVVEKYWLTPSLTHQPSSKLLQEWTLPLKNPEFVIPGLSTKQVNTLMSLIDKGKDRHENLSGKPPRILEGDALNHMTSELKLIKNTKSIHPI